MGGMPIPPEPRPDHPDEHDARAPLPDTGAVLFSHAPAPEPEPSDGAADGEQTGWPWFLPQDGLRRDHLAGAVDAETDPAGAAAAYAQIPLVAAATALLEHVGDGREVTADGGLPLAEVHALLDAWQLDPGGQELTTMWQVGEIAGPWNALLSGGWLTVTGTRVHPADGVTPAASPTQDPAAFVRFARALTLLLVLDALRQDPERGGLFGDPDTFAALLHTLAPEGLALPATIRVALDRGLVPSDPAGDPDMDEIQRYWRAQSDLAALASYGLLHREITPGGQENRWRGTLEAVVEIFGALEMADDPDAAR